MKFIFFFLCVFLVLNTSTTLAQISGEADLFLGCYSVSAAAWPDSLNHLSNPNKFPKLIKFTNDPLTIELTGKDGTKRIVQPEGYENAYRIKSMKKEYYGLDQYLWKINDDSTNE